MPLENIFDEAMQLLDQAKERHLSLKLFGGIAIYMSCPSARTPPLTRRYVDIDLMGRSKQADGIKKLFLDLGYTPRDKFNAMYGYRRLVFNDMDHQRRVDIFLDIFEMCHRFDFKERLLLEGATLPPADLLATKLQVVEINQKDFKDLTCLLLDHEVGNADGDQINGAYLARLCANDWGIYKTLTTNLGRLSAFVPSLLDVEQSRIVGTRITALKKLVEDEPKALKWKMRARIGERAAWYILPEADKEVVDSRLPEGLSQGAG